MITFIWILFCHYLADFVFQSHWMASNKSKNNAALLAHVGLYTLIMTGCFAGLVMINDPYRLPNAEQSVLIFCFAVATWITHLVTDYVTSRWSAPKFAAAINAIKLAERHPAMAAKYPTLPYFCAGKHLHDFFVVIGLDQFVHQSTLAATLIWLGVA